MLELNTSVLVLQQGCRGGEVKTSRAELPVLLSRELVYSWCPSIISNWKNKFLSEVLQQWLVSFWRGCALRSGKRICL